MKKLFLYRGYDWTRVEIDGQEVHLFPSAQHGLDDKNEYVATLVDKGLLVEVPPGKEPGPAPHFQAFAPEEAELEQPAPTVVSTSSPPASRGPASKRGGNPTKKKGG